jgi:hypothetical protein
MNTNAASTTQFKFLDAKLYVKHVRAHPSILLAHNETLNKGVLARYNLPSVELKSFTFSKGAQSLSMDNAVLGTAKTSCVHLVENTDYLGSMDSNPYNCKHYDKLFLPVINGKQYTFEGLTMDMGKKNICNNLQYAIRRHRHSSFRHGVANPSASHKSHPENGVVRI